MSFTDFGFDFRRTPGFVTDPVYAAVSTATSQFPTTYTNGNGDTASAGMLFIDNRTDDNDRNSTIDPRLAGTVFNGQSNSGATSFTNFIVTLPTAGNWIIHAAFGDAVFAQNLYIQFFDGASQFANYVNVGVAPNNFMDATGVVFPEIFWVNASAGGGNPLVHNFVNTQLNIQLGPTSTVPGDPTSSPIAHLRLTFLPSPGGGGGGTWEQMDILWQSHKDRGTVLN